MALKRLVFRATRGKAYAHFFPMHIDKLDLIKGLEEE